MPAPPGRSSTRHAGSLLIERDRRYAALSELLEELADAS
jgi:hypothetical protein